MEDFNIENYKDYENITIAEYKAALANVEKTAWDAARKGDLETAWHYAKIYFELNKLLDKKIIHGSRNGYGRK